MWLDEHLGQYDRLDLVDRIRSRVPEPAPGPNPVQHPGFRPPVWTVAPPGLGDAEIQGAMALPLDVPDVGALVNRRWVVSLLSTVLGGGVTLRAAAVTVPPWTVLVDGPGEQPVRLPYLVRDGDRVAVGFRGIVPHPVAESLLLVGPWAVAYARDDPSGAPRLLEIQGMVLGVSLGPLGATGRTSEALPGTRRP